MDTDILKALEYVALMMLIIFGVSLIIIGLALHVIPRNKLYLFPLVGGVLFIISFWYGVVLFLGIMLTLAGFMAYIARYTFLKDDDNRDQNQEGLSHEK